MTTVSMLIRRNTKLFFKDKGLFFTSLITPVILLVLYASFLGNIYRDSFMLSIPEWMEIPERIIGGCVGGQLTSSILAVSCVTVSFCSNMLMVQDKVNGAALDMAVTPVKPYMMALGYYLATLISTMTVCLAALGMCFIYMAIVGFYMSAWDVVLLLLDVIILVMFGTALSSIINFFLSTQGQISAVGTIVSSVYGFVCGAYMPISQFSEGLQKVICMLPGTYGTSLVRNHAMNGALRALEDEGLPAAAIAEIRDAVDCNIYFFDTRVSVGAMYAVVVLTVLLLVGVYVWLNVMRERRSTRVK